MISSDRLRHRRLTTPRHGHHHRRLNSSRANRTDWRKPLGILGVASIALLAASLVLMSRSDALIQSSLRTDEQGWDPDILHIVITRFMQNQPKLVWLARARLLLFQYICLPTMAKQTTQQFLWIIETDPRLDRDVRHTLSSLLKPYPNFFLLGTNLNPTSSFRDMAKDLLKARVYSGNIKLLRQAYLSRNLVPLLQTRLDADDGLQLDYLQRLQDEAQQLFSTSKKKNFGAQDSGNSQNWYYWCVKRHLEWYADSHRLNPVEHSKLCVTPGLTVGLAAEPLSSEPPWIMAHDLLFKTLAADTSTYSCGGPVCIRMVDQIAMGAVRARTWTSAGMMDILSEEVPDKAGGIPQEQLWEILDKQFGLSSSRLKNDIQSFLKQNLVNIAKDNLEGQCTEGHSCKLKSVEALQRLMEIHREGESGKDVLERVM